jgi:hypothetical protein
LIDRRDKLNKELDAIINPKPKKKGRVTKKAANEAYDKLSWALTDLSGHLPDEFERRDVPAFLEPRMEVIQDLLDRGWPDGVVHPESIMTNARRQLNRWNEMKTPFDPKNLAPTGYFWTKSIHNSGEGYSLFSDDDDPEADETLAYATIEVNIKTGSATMFSVKPDSPVKRRMEMGNKRFDSLEEAMTFVKDSFTGESVSPVEPVDPAPVADNADKTWLVSAASASNEEMATDDFYNKLIELVEKYDESGDPELFSAATNAMEYYSNFALSF